MKNKLSKIIYDLLQSRPFCKCSIKEKKMYSAYCLRICETVEMKLDEKFMRIDYITRKKK